jgi:acetyl-CoA carboxylase biotin carboxyl carrier protein
MPKKAKVSTKGGAEAFSRGLSEIERVLTFMQKHGLEELVYERPGIHIRLRKASTRPPGGYQPLSVPDIAVPVEPSPSHLPSAGSRDRPPAPAVHLIKSPIVGTYYAAPGPEADPFVAVGNDVEAGQVLCIIEAMKLMNEIESDVAGEILEILVENGQPVEYGQPLFGIRAKGKK